MDVCLTVLVAPVVGTIVYGTENETINATLTVRGMVVAEVTGTRVPPNPVLPPDPV